MLSSEQKTMQKLTIDVELLKQENVHAKESFDKLDVAIEKISDVANNISKILSLHEHKVATLESDLNSVASDVDKVNINVYAVKQEIEKLIDDDRDEINIRFSKIENDLSELNKYKYYIFSALAIAFIVLDNLEKITTIFNN